MSTARQRRWRRVPERCAYVTNHKTGSRALTLQRVLGLRSDQTACPWLHKLRRAMLRGGVGRGIGRIRLARIHDGSAETVAAFIADAIETRSRVRTDGWQGDTQLYANEITLV